MTTVQCFIQLVARFNDAEVTSSDIEETVLSAGSILLVSTFHSGAVALQDAIAVVWGITQSAPITVVTSNGHSYLAATAFVSITDGVGSTSPAAAAPSPSIDVAEYALVGAAVVLLVVFVLLCVAGKPDGEDHALLSCCASLCAFAGLSGTVVVQHG